MKSVAFFIVIRSFSGSVIFKTQPQEKGDTRGKRTVFFQARHLCQKRSAGVESPFFFAVSYLDVPGS